jgi:hypothetical protein
MKLLDSAVLIESFHAKAGAEPIIGAVIGLTSEPIIPWRRRSWLGVRGTLEDCMTGEDSYTVCWTPTRMLFTRDGDASVRSVEDIFAVDTATKFDWYDTFDPAAILPGETVQEAYERHIDEDTRADIDAGEYESGESWDEGDPSISHRSGYFTTGA